MAYMVKTGQADFAISEDSDLIAYGCPLIAMKLSYNGTFQRYSAEKFRSFKEEKSKKDKAISNLQSFEQKQFI